MSRRKALQHSEAMHWWTRVFQVIPQALLRNDILKGESQSHEESQKDASLQPLPPPLNKAQGTRECRTSLTVNPIKKIIPISLSLCFRAPFVPQARRAHRVLETSLWQRTGSPKAERIESECELGPGTASPGLAGSRPARLLCPRASDGQAPRSRDPAPRKGRSGEGGRC